MLQLAHIVVGASRCCSTFTPQRRRSNLQTVKKRLGTPGIERLFCDATADAGSYHLNGARIVQ